jgi:hypothetical protein
MERERSLGLNVEVSARFARRRRSIERRLSQRSKLKHCVFEIPNSTERCKCMVEDRSRLSTRLRRKPTHPCARSDTCSVFFPSL